jgi:hypothetical protein
VCGPSISTKELSQRPLESRAVEGDSPVDISPLAVEGIPSSVDRIFRVKMAGTNCQP